MVRPFISLGPGADDNAFAAMLADLVRQNLESKPHKQKDLAWLARGPGVNVAIVAADAEVSLTLAFHDGALVLHDGIFGVPDVTVRGTAEIVMAMSNVPLTKRLALPLPTDRPSLEVLRDLVRATRSGELEVFGMVGHLGVLLRLTRVMSVNG